MEEAQQVAHPAFHDADNNPIYADGLLDFDEFYRWYREVLGAALQMIQAASWKSMDDFRRLTHLGQHDLKDVIEVFVEQADKDGHLTFEPFERCILSLQGNDLVLEESEKRQRRLAIERLFQIFDVDNNCVVDIIELASGISVLCDRDQDHQFEIIFRVFDKESEGFMTFQDLEPYLSCVFKVLQEVGGAVPRRGAVLCRRFGTLHC